MELVSWNRFSVGTGSRVPPVIHVISFSGFLVKNMDHGGGVLELHTQELKMPHTMIMQDFGR